MPWIAFVVSFGTNLIVVPILRRIARRLGKVAQPREDRWHRESTPILGGIGIFVAFALGVLVAGASFELPLGLLAGSVLIFVLGIVDDVRPISPQTKLLGQIISAAVVVFFGHVTDFFPWELANILLSFIWIVGITNAFNLLDNMDGLAGGMALIAAGFMTFFFWRTGDQTFMLLSLALAGAALGFLLFNFPPASIFMGDSGSLFLGFTLAALAIARTPQASNVFAIVGVPTLVFLLPILDTTMVTVTRLLRGQSPTKGGKDHTSHRLVALGLSERQALLGMFGVAVASGLGAIAIEAISYSLSLILIPVLVLTFTLLTAYLGRMKVITSTEPVPRGRVLSLMVELTYKRRLFEVALDFFLMTLAYYLAFATRFGLPLSAYNMELFLNSLPIVLASTYLSFFAFGVYRGVWRYTGLEDLVRFAKGVMGGTGLAIGALLMLFRFEGYSRAVFFIYPLILFIALAASRYSFRLLDQSTKRSSDERMAPVLIYGAGDAGELTLRECQRNISLGYLPIGFLDDDPLKWGRTIHGLDVLGGLDKLEGLLKERGIEGLIIASAAIRDTDSAEKAVSICSKRGVWIRGLRLEFEDLD